jgi:hypothetical protein
MNITELQLLDYQGPCVIVLGLHHASYDRMHLGCIIEHRFTSWHRKYNTIIKVQDVILHQYLFELWFVLGVASLQLMEITDMNGQPDALCPAQSHDARPVQPQLSVH